MASTGSNPVDKELVKRASGRKKKGGASAVSAVPSAPQPAPSAVSAGGVPSAPQPAPSAVSAGGVPSAPQPAPSAVSAGGMGEIVELDADRDAVVVDMAGTWTRE